jgi:hypothetical protein
LSSTQEAAVGAVVMVMESVLLYSILAFVMAEVLELHLKSTGLAVVQRAKVQLKEEVGRLKLLTRVWNPEQAGPEKLLLRRTVLLRQQRRFHA